MEILNFDVVSSERPRSDLSEYILSQIKKNIFFIYTKQFLSEKLEICFLFFAFFFLEILPKFSDFINSDDWIGKIASKSIRLQPVY